VRFRIPSAGARENNLFFALSRLNNGVIDSVHEAKISHFPRKPMPKSVMHDHTPTVRHIIGVVRRAGPQGCTVGYLMHATGGTRQAVQKALQLQLGPGGILATEERWDGERYLGVFYSVLEGA
jgi:hypothetical protein